MREQLMQLVATWRRDRSATEEDYNHGYIAGQVDAANELEALLADQAEAGEDAEKVMPVNGVGTIPWAMIAPHERQAQANHSQTLDRLRERGGLSPCEALAILENRPWKKMDMRHAAAEVRRRRETFLNPPSAGEVEAVAPDLRDAASDELPPPVRLRTLGYGKITAAPPAGGVPDECWREAINEKLSEIGPMKLTETGLENLQSRAHEIAAARGKK